MLLQVTDCLSTGTGGRSSTGGGTVLPRQKSCPSCVVSSPRGEVVLPCQLARQPHSARQSAGASSARRRAPSAVGLFLGARRLSSLHTRTRIRHDGAAHACRVSRRRRRPLPMPIPVAGSMSSALRRTFWLLCRWAVLPEPPAGLRIRRRRSLWLNRLSVPVPIFLTERDGTARLAVAAVPAG